MITKVCKICGKKLKASRQTYCSRECYYKDKELLENREQKRKDACIKKYGKEQPCKGVKRNNGKIHWSHTKEGKSKISHRLKKSIENDGKLHLSKNKLECYNILKSKYKNVKLMHNISNTDIFTDFYINDIRTYIDYHGDFQHMHHPYNEENDKYKLSILESKEQPYYKYIINTWVNKDPEKRQFMKDHKLKYIEFWNLNDAMKWVKEKRKLSEYINE